MYPKYTDFEKYFFIYIQELKYQNFLHTEQNLITRISPNYQVFGLRLQFFLYFTRLRNKPHCQWILILGRTRRAHWGVLWQMYTMATKRYSSIEWQRLHILIIHMLKKTRFSEKNTPEMLSSEKQGIASPIRFITMNWSFCVAVSRYNRAYFFCASSFACFYYIAICKCIPFQLFENISASNDSFNFSNCFKNMTNYRNILDLFFLKKNILI